MLDRLQEALKASTADYCEIRFEEDDRTTIAYRGKEIEDVSTSRLAGGLIRACKNGGWAVVTFDALDLLSDRVAECCRSAAMVGGQGTKLAQPKKVGRGEYVAALSRDWRGISLDTKLALCQHYNSLLLGSYVAIESTSVRYGERIRSVWYVNSFGAAYREDRPRVVISYGATARRGDLVQQGFDSVASVSDYGVVEGREKEVLAAAKMAVDLLDAPPVEGQTCDVILDPELGGVFAHEAFGHLSEADFLYENPKMCELMHVGRKVGVKELTIVDDGSIPNSLGSQRFDDEGVPMQKTKLITNGILTRHLHSLETAGTMNAEPTGNARAIGRRSSPIVRMTNTYIEAGSESFESLIKGIDHGLYCCRAFGGQTMMEQFTFSAGHARRIEYGKLGELVRDVVLTGNVFSTLEHMDGFGSDLIIEQNGGGCGKGGQSPLPVTDGAPHLRVRQVTVGGKAQ